MIHTTSTEQLQMVKIYCCFTSTSVAFFKKYVICNKHLEIEIVIVLQLILRYSKCCRLNFTQFVVTPIAKAKVVTGLRWQSNPCTVHAICWARRVWRALHVSLQELRLEDQKAGGH